MRGGMYLGSLGRIRLGPSYRPFQRSLGRVDIQQTGNIREDQLAHLLPAILVVLGRGGSKDDIVSIGQEGLPARVPLGIDGILAAGLVTRDACSIRRRLTRRSYFSRRQFCRSGRSASSRAGSGSSSAVIDKGRDAQASNLSALVVTSNLGHLVVVVEIIVDLARGSLQDLDK